jgi:hypothetical protein
MLGLLVGRWKEKKQGERKETILSFSREKLREGIVFHWTHHFYFLEENEREQ